MRKAGLALLFGMALFANCLAVVALPEAQRGDWMVYGAVLVVVLCHGLAGFLELGGAAAWAARRGAEAVALGVVSLIVTLGTTALAYVLATRFPLAMNSVTSHLLLAIGAGFALVGLVLASVSGRSLALEIGVRNPRRF